MHSMPAQLTTVGETLRMCPETLMVFMRAWAGAPQGRCTACKDVTNCSTRHLQLLPGACAGIVQVTEDHSCMGGYGQASLQQFLGLHAHECAATQCSIPAALNSGNKMR